MTNNSISSNYLSKCDLIHKLAINNINQCPEIEKILIQFSLKNLKENTSSNIELNNQIKGILLFYVLFGLNSEIKYNSEKNVVENYTKKNLSSYFSQKITLKNKNSITKFVQFLFLENDFKSIAKISGFKKLKTENNSICLCVTIPFSIFSDLNEFANFSIKDVSTKELTMNVSFFIKNLKDSQDANILMLAPFWHFG